MDESPMLTEAALANVGAYFRRTGWAADDDEPERMLRNDARNSAEAFLAAQDRDALASVVRDVLENNADPNGQGGYATEAHLVVAALLGKVG